MNQLGTENGQLYGTEEAGYKTLVLVVYNTSLFSVDPKWLVVRPHFFFEVPKWSEGGGAFCKKYFSRFGCL